MSALAPAWAERFDALTRSMPDAEARERRAQFEGFAATGLPGPDDEAWHYTDLAPLAGTAFQLALSDAGDDEPLAPLLEGCDRLVYRNGSLDARHSTASSLDARSRTPATPGAGLDALNAAFATGGLALVLADNARTERPLQVLIQTDTGETPAMTHQRHRITLGANAEATVLLHFVGRGGTRLSTHGVDVQLAAGARLRLHHVADEGDGATLVTTLTAQLSRDARLDLSAIDIGRGLSRLGADLVIGGAGAEIHTTSLQMPGPRAHADQRMRVVHDAPHGVSRIVARGILDERARAIFNGRVVVKPGAQKTDSEQRLANLLLSRKAEVNAKPDLEIHADDVKCAHGATVGQLDEIALAYLRSRGIPLAEARALLLRAFAVDVLDRLAWPALKALIAARLKLPAADDLADGEEDSE